MKKVVLVLGIIVAALGAALAQEFKVAKSSGRLELNIGRVTVEGYNGNEIIFSSKDHREKEDERANGLRAINSLGLEDNTGLGINVTDKGNVIEVNQLKKMNSPDVKIMVPKGFIVSFSFESQYGGTAAFKNMENEIEVSANYNSVELENVTGPLTVKTVYGHVEAELSQNVKGPISIVSAVKICTGYKLHGTVVDILPAGSDACAACEPIYEEMPGWTETTFGVKTFAGLPVSAQNYVKRLAELCGTKIALVSTGPDRDETIVLDHPFGL